MASISTIICHANAKVEEDTQRLWEASERLTGAEFVFSQPEITTG
ncbi:MAG: hypothetical protein ACQETE_09295 [Bacteroidota bacterium]